MSASPMSEAIDALAVEWVIRRDRAVLSPVEQVELDSWLASDTRCAGAFARAEAAWTFLGRARALPEPSVSLEPERVATAPKPPVASRKLRWAGGAVAAVAAGVIAFSVISLRSPAYETSLGEVRSVPLADGSVVAINTDSRMKVAMDEQRRTVQLGSGEAWFQVSRDPSRPFIVEAGRVRVQAIGTAFSVRRRDGGVDVLVTDGVVNAWVVGEEERKLRLPLGSKAFVSDEGDGAEVVTAAAVVERGLAWRAGKIDLKGETLAQAAAEFNRYNERRLVIDDASLAGEPVVGRFGLHEPEAFANAAASMFGARIVAEGDELRLIREAAR